MDAIEKCLDTLPGFYKVQWKSLKKHIKLTPYKLSVTPGYYDFDGKNIIKIGMICQLIHQGINRRLK